MGTQMHTCTHVHMYTQINEVSLSAKKKGHFKIKLRLFQVRVGTGARRNGGGVALSSTGIHQLKYSQ